MNLFKVSVAAFVFSSSLSASAAPQKSNPDVAALIKFGIQKAKATPRGKEKGAITNVFIGRTVYTFLLPSVKSRGMSSAGDATAGINGSWAEIVVSVFPASSKVEDEGKPTGYILKRVGKTWRLVASNSNYRGFGNLRAKGVPYSVAEKLNWFEPKSLDLYYKEPMLTEAMKQLTAAIQRKDTKTVLALASYGIYLNNTINGGESSDMQSFIEKDSLKIDFQKRGQLYQFFFSTSVASPQSIDDIGVTLADTVKLNGLKGWIKTGNGKFLPQKVPSSVSREQMYVRWQFQEGKWILSRVGQPIS